MTDGGVIIRTATAADIPAIKSVMARAIAELQSPWLDPAQVAASATMMGLDTQLIEDASYLVAEIDGIIIGCGGWSRRATSYGGDHSPGRSIRLLDPATEPARIRAMYTDPAYVRRGVGRAILLACETAASAAEFKALALVATLSGEPLYRVAGYRDVERFEDTNGGVPVPMVRMCKDLN